MSDHIGEPAAAAPEPSAEARAPASNQRFRVAAVIVIVVVAAAIAFLALRDGDTTPNSNATGATAVSADQIRALADSVGHPVFWVGPKAGYTYELLRTSNGSILIRYLPEGVKVGAKEGYLTVATYPFPGAYAAIQTIAKGEGITSFALGNGGLAEVPTRNPTSVHAAYPGVDYQVEVYDPTAGTATALARGGSLQAFGSLASTSEAAKPTGASVAQLEALAATLGHPVYWAGPRNGYTYELTQTADGQVTIRYLPPGAKVGQKGEYLTVATYPYAGAFTAIDALSKQPDAVVIKTPGGGVAVAEPKYRKNIHLAYPGADYQLEVFAPTAALAKRVVTSGQVEEHRLSRAVPRAEERDGGP